MMLIIRGFSRCWAPFVRLIKQKPLQMTESGHYLGKRGVEIRAKRENVVAFFKIIFWCKG